MIKKRFGALLCAVLILCVLLTAYTSVFAAETIAGNKSVDGVAYKLSDDGTFYTVVGYSEDFHKLTIVAEIDGIPVTAISESAFQNNSRLTEIFIPASVTSIGKSAFRFCENLVSVTLSGSLTSIPEECFYDCSMLKNITLPKNLTEIGDRAFYNCTMLSKIKIPAAVTSIGYDTFHGCESIVLDISENDYASNYARENNINTDFRNTTAYFMLLMLLGIAVATVLFLILSFFMRKHIKKHPSHNPGIYIERFFIHIGNGFGFVFDKIGKLFNLLKARITLAVNRLGEFIRARRLKKAEKKAQRKSEKGE
ncbi:MAG: leucine-rich repeat domain-containing protein [Clostridia bacterium]|nr:leucine-rich repeat domain-containing protein [Clostridia bacterium]